MEDIGNSLDDVGQQNHELMHVYYFLQIIVQENLMNIQMVYRPRSRETQAKYCVYGAQFDNQIKSLITVNT